MILPLWFKIILCVFLFFVGASVYSFLNVVIFRVPRGEEFVKTRSHCPGCGRILTPLELIPVVSYICLGGKCKNCGSKIGLRDVSIEIFGGLSAIVTFFYYFSEMAGKSMLQTKMMLQGDELNLLYVTVLAGFTTFVFIGALTVICFINLDTGKIKSGTLIALGVAGLAGVFTMPAVSLVSRFIAAVICLTLFGVLGLLSKGTDYYGAAVLLGISGFLMGGRVIAAVAMLAVLLGALEAVILLLTGNKKIDGRFKLIPILCAAVLVSIFYGPAIAALFFL